RDVADYLRERIARQLPQVWMVDPSLTVANIVMVALEDVHSETAVTSLDRAGICASGGSACSSGATQPSHVLAAMNVDARYRSGPVRMSLGEQTTKQDADRVVAALVEVQSRLGEQLLAGAARVRTA